MPSKKKKYNARFPAGRIKKIMQSDEEVGKVAQAVPVIISKTLELFVESLLVKSLRITTSRNAKTLSPSHMKQCIMAESRFDFLRELVKNIPDISVAEEIAHDNSPGPPPLSHQNDTTPYDLTMPSTSCGITIQASPTVTNGNPHRNGLEIHVSIPPVQRSASVPCTLRSDLKRTAETPYEAVATRYAADFYKESPVIRHTSTIDTPTAAVSASEMMASYAADFYKESVAVIKHTSDVTSTKARRIDNTATASALTSLPTQTSVRRLQHQSKSIPCTSKESQLQSSMQLTSHTHSIITPAPIINVDICNKPVVKIDYSNIALPEKEPIDGTTNEDKSKNLASACISPVINIDLSNIVPKPKSTLDLDEDYDNI